MGLLPQVCGCLSRCRGLLCHLHHDRCCAIQNAHRECRCTVPSAVAATTRHRCQASQGHSRNQLDRPVQRVVGSPCLVLISLIRWAVTWPLCWSASHAAQHWCLCAPASAAACSVQAGGALCAIAAREFAFPLVWLSPQAAHPTTPRRRAESHRTVGQNCRRGACCPLGGYE